MRSYLFQEVQRVRQPWIYALLIIVFGLWMWQLIQQVILGVPFGSQPSPDWAVFLIGLVPVGAIVLVALLKLETKVSKEAFQYRMWPLQHKFRELKPGDITQWEVKKYNPVRDYGGWGIRVGFGKKGMAINVSGNQGAYFELKNGKKILIGTRRPEELRSALNRMKSA